ncbi:MAG: tyrosine-type recombinase/integrase [Desulfobacteraceae bacterium]|nr:tyrosine-type recombinase/integrase [Desulfobacteraceae bacterium]
MPTELIKVLKYPGVYYRNSLKKKHNGRPDKCFYVSYRNGAGKFVREKVGWASEGYSAEMATHIRFERLRKIRHGKELPDRKKKELTFAQAWKRYDQWLETGRKHTYDDRNRYKNHIKRRFGSKSLSQITTDNLEKFKQDLLTKKQLSPATTKHVLVIIRQVYNKMNAWKLYNGNSPTKGLKMPKLNNKRVRFLTKEEADKLLEAVKKKSHQVWEMSLLSLHTGMRANEIFSLLWGHINFQNASIHIADPKGGRPRDAY